MPQAGPSVILIPAYNEEANIQKTVELIRKTGINSKIVVVNDGSVDRTSEIAKSLNCTVIDLQKNFGKATAFIVGLDFILKNKNFEKKIACNYNH